MDFEESVRSSKVLQGQENVGFVSPLYGCDAVNHPLDFEMRTPAHQNLALTGIGKGNVNEFMRARPTTYTGFMESNRFPKVLQGQEICPLRSLTGKVDLNLGTWGKPNLGCNSFSMYQAAKPNFYALPSESLQNMYFTYGDMQKTGKNPTMPSYGNNFPRETVQFNSSSIQTGLIGDEVRKPNLLNEHKPPESLPMPTTFKTNLRNKKDGSFNGTVAGCKLFGFSLTAETPAPSSQSTGKRSCTKVSILSSSQTKLGTFQFLFQLSATDLTKLCEGSQTRKHGWKSY